MTHYEQGYVRYMKLAGLYKTETKKRSETPYGKKEAAHGDSAEGGKPYTQQDVQYTDSSPDPNRTCDKCAHYQPDGACALVMGAISPKGWCNKFSAE